MSAALAAVVLVAACAPADGSTPSSPVPAPTAASATPSRPDPTTDRSTSRTATPTPTLPVQFALQKPLLDGGAALVVEELHRISGFRPALKLNVSKEEVTLTVVTKDFEARSYRWRDGVIEVPETDVQYLKQTTFWPTDFVLDNVRLLFDNATLLGTSSNGQVLQVVEYRPGEVYMSVTTSPETSTIFFRKDGTVFRSLGVTAVADIREGVDAVTGGERAVYSVRFDAESGYHAELPSDDGYIERRTRMANRPTFISKHSGTPALSTFDPDLLDPATLAQTIAAHDSGSGCLVEIDDRFDRVQPVATYTCDGDTYHSDLKGRDLTAQLR